MNRAFLLFALSVVCASLRAHPQAREYQPPPTLLVPVGPQATAESATALMLGRKPTASADANKALSRSMGGSRR